MTTSNSRTNRRLPAHEPQATRGERPAFVRLCGRAIGRHDEDFHRLLSNGSATTEAGDLEEMSLADLQERIRDLEERLSLLEGRMAKLEEAIQLL